MPPTSLIGNAITSPAKSTVQLSTPSQESVCCTTVVRSSTTSTSPGVAFGPGSTVRVRFTSVRDVSAQPRNGAAPATRVSASTSLAPCTRIACALFMCSFSSLLSSTFVTRRHATAPCAALRASRLDELLETLQNRLHAPAHHTHPVADVLRDALRHVVELKHHATRVVLDPVERHDAGVAGASRAPPCDPLVGDLLDDLGVP